MESTIAVREMTFEVERESGGVWNNRYPEMCHTLNAFQLALPFLEPYFIDALRGARERIDDLKLAGDVAAFCAQEANHARQHRRYCRLLRKHYPGLADYETKIQRSLIASRQHDSLDWRLAYTAGYEAITAELARWLFRCAGDWFPDQEHEFAKLMTWHAVEEIEHRHVAFDALQSVNPNYLLRVRGLAAAMHKTWTDMVPVVTYLLEVDGYHRRWDSKLRRLVFRVRFLTELGPMLARYLRPGYHPSQDPVPPGYAAWLERYSKSESLSVPARERVMARRRQTHASHTPSP